MPKTTTWDTVKWKHILLIPGDDQKCGRIEVVYNLGDGADVTASRDMPINMGREHPLLAKTIAQAIASTSPRLTVVDALVALLVADIKAQEGL